VEGVAYATREGIEIMKRTHMHTAAGNRFRGKQRLSAKVKAVAIFAVVLGVAAVGAYLVAFGPGAQLSSSGHGGMVMNFHAKLEIFVDGAPATVPANIGIAPSLWKSHAIDQFGVGGAAPLNTRDSSGTINVESNANHNFTLGNLFNIWGVPFSETCVLDNAECSGSGTVTVLVNGMTNTEFRNHVLKDGEIIHIEFNTGG
jgi:hypothetical protein